MAEITSIPPVGYPSGTSLLQQQVLQPYREFYLGNLPSPRLAIDIGVNWNSPFGPFRIDIAKALLTESDDEAAPAPTIHTFQVII